MTDDAKKQAEERRAAEEAAKREAAQVAAAAAAADAKEDTEPRYTQDDLRDNARSLLDVSPHAVAAIFAGEQRQTLTLAQAQDAVGQFVKREQEVAS